MFRICDYETEVQDKKIRWRRMKTLKETLRKGIKHEVSGSLDVKPRQWYSITDLT